MIKNYYLEINNYSIFIDDFISNTLLNANS